MKKTSKTQKNTELIYGLHPIIELLKAKKRKLVILYTTKPVPKGFAQLEPLLPRGLQTQYVKREVLAKLAGTTDHQSVVGYAAPFVYQKNFFEASKHTTLLLLDGIQDVRNLGAIIRTSYCTGIDGIIVPKKGTAPINAAALKASAGLAEHCRIVQTASSSGAAQLLQKEGYSIYLATFGGEDIRTVDFKKPLCLVIGAEGRGISKELLEYGTSVTLPQQATGISYNASVAAGILMFHVMYE